MATVDIQVTLADDSAKPLPLDGEILVRSLTDSTSTFQPHKTNGGTVTVKVEEGHQILIRLPHALQDANKVKYFRRDTDAWAHAPQAGAGPLKLSPFTYAKQSTARTEIAGRLVREDGKDLAPLRKTRVAIFDATDTKVGEAYTGIDGWYKFSVPGNARYSIRPLGVVRYGSNDYRPDTDSLIVDVREEPQMCIKQAFQYSAPRARLGGSVLDQAGHGLTGVKIHLTHESGECWDRLTDECGHYCFENVPVGDHTLLFQSEAEGPAGRLELAAGSPDHVPIRLEQGDVRNIPAAVYVPEAHSLTCRILTADGIDPGLLVEVSDDPKTFVRRVRSKDGIAHFPLDKGGKFKVKVYSDPEAFGEALESTVTINSHGEVTVPYDPPKSLNNGTRRSITKPGPGGGGGGGGGSGVDLVGDIQAYPILTSEAYVRGGGGSFGGAGGAAAGAGTAAIVQNTIREVLGWRPKVGDSKAFTAALAKSFSPYDSNGATLYKWTPRTYLADVNADLGALTGAQASLYQRAKVAIDQSLPLLEGLYPLLPEYDPQDTEASRALVRSDLNELVSELGVIGGPRPQRVERYFKQLLGKANGNGNNKTLRTNANQLPADSHLGRMEARFGLTQARVNTVEEEQNLTNFLILVDYVRSLKATWDANFPYFSRGTSGEDVSPFLGTQIILLSRALGVVAESVREVEMAMDSVFLGPEQRATIRLDMGEEEPDLFASELLDWAADVSTEEGPRQLQEAGRDGVIALGGTLEELADHVESALLTEVDPENGLQDRADVPPAYATPRVQRALLELATQLRAAYDLAEPYIPDDNG